jgi:secretion/DNA translocation related TadE-like protein
MRRRGAVVGEEGMATVWVLAAGVVIVLVAVAFASAGAATVARHRAESAADLAALAGALRVVDGTDTACARSADVSAANGAHMVACTVDGLDVTIVVEVSAIAGIWFSGTARAAARAGPVEAG